MTDATPAIEISLVIPTFNRSAYLSAALASVAATQTQQPRAIEVIVADNNSSDNTAMAVEHARASGFPFELRHVVETTPGVSAARNRGIAVARGTYIVFMDDDQRIEEHYLTRIIDVFGETGAAVVGGPLRYANEQNVPAWADELLATFGQFDAGDERRSLTPDERLFNGGSMAIRSDVLREVGDFDTTLGRAGNSLLANEEIEIQRRIYAAGHAIVYSPKLVQYHYLRPERLTKRYWRRHRFDWGRTLYREHRSHFDSRRNARLFGAPRWFWSSLVARELPRYVRSLVGSTAEERFSRQLDIFFRLGQIHEAQRSRHESRASSNP